MKYLIENLRVYIWAAMHHPDFHKCYMQPVIKASFDRFEYTSSWTFKVEFYWTSLYIFYIPFNVQSAYYYANGSTLEDEMPF